VADLLLVCDLSIAPEDLKKSVVSCMGLEEAGIELDSEVWVESAILHGTAIQIATGFASTLKAAERKCLRDSEAPAYFDDPVDRYLDRVVNRIGTTGREFLEGNILAGLHRSKAQLEEKRTVRQGEGVQSRTIKQRSLSNECWLVQIWGLDRCETCDLKDTEDCGGKRIRETGYNEKGLLVPLPD
jgi:hypothetical protein